MSRSEYFEVFLSTLRANGLVAIPIRGGYRIQPIEGAATPADAGDPQRRGGNQFVTEIIRLRSIDATGALETVRPLVSPQGSVTANTNANSLVVVDFADNVARIRQLLRHDRAAEAARRPDRTRRSSICATPARARSRPRCSSWRRRTRQRQRRVASARWIRPTPSLLRGEPRGRRPLRARLTRDLDARAVEGTEIRVYWLEHADAEQLLPVLQQLVGQAVDQSRARPRLHPRPGRAKAPAPVPPRRGRRRRRPAYGGGTGIVRRGPAVVARYPGTNAIIIAANADAQRQLGEVIRQLDTRREQVLVEAIIVEIGDDAAKRLGVQFLLAGKNAPFARDQLFERPAQHLHRRRRDRQLRAWAARPRRATDGTITTTYDSPLGQGDHRRRGLSRSWRRPAASAAGSSKSARTPWFGAIINAVKSDTESNILSTPSIMTLDNQEAKLLVGQEVPVTTGESARRQFRQCVPHRRSARTSASSSTSSRRSIRRARSSCSSARKCRASPGRCRARSADLIINKREFKTVLTVDDGEILAIGGLLDENERRTIEKIPLLGDIPVVGELFKSRSRARPRPT